MDKTFWNERFGEPGFMYGDQPNDFLKATSSSLKPGGRILCLAEGEGRNAVYLATQGFDVTCVDFSESGLKKTEQLSESHGVSVCTVCADLGLYEIEHEAWDGIVMIFGHFNEGLRASLYKRISAGLKPGGTLLMEVYTKDQLSYGTGGPKSIEYLYDKQELEAAFSEFSSVSIQEVIREINEGEYHKGLSATVQVIAIK
ncbi:MAG: Tellurite methyltransferase [Bacteroidota bacterium]|jgi:cyclopropane fatty-acyl-phospholipid synthase-like methyltransferase